MPLTSPPTIDMDLEDFRRLGVRPYECRLTVIRRAAARSAKALAEQQLSAPSDQVGLQLSRVTTSTYRLLDPRQRQDPTQRIHVGRILPNALTWAGHTSFCSDSPESSASAPFSTDVVRDAALIELLEFDASSRAQDESQPWEVTLNDGDLLQTTPRSRRAAQMRGRRQLPWLLLSLAGLVVGTILGFATLRRNYVPTISKVSPGLDVTVESAAPIDRAPIDRAPALQPTVSSAQQNAASVEVPQSSEISATETSATEISLAEVREPVESKPEVASLAAELSPASAGVASSDVAPQSEPLMLDSSPAPTETQVDIGDAFLPDPFATAVDRKNEPPEMSEVTVPEPMPMTRSADPPSIAELPTAAPEAQLRHPLPDDAAVSAARRQLVLLIPQLAQTVTPKNVQERIAAIEALDRDLAIGSADHWSAQVWIAQLAWYSEDVSQVSQRLKSLTEQYEVSLERPLAESFVAAAHMATLPETHQHFLGNGLQLADKLLMSESFEQCTNVIDAIVPSAELLESESSLGYLDDFSQATEQTSRLGESAKRMIDETGAVDSESGDVGILGRYYCLMLRQWEFGLPWLTEVSDPRIASVARAETELDDAAVTEDWVSLSERWFSAAARSRGRTADSMRLHAIEILKRAATQASVLTKLEIERKIDEATDELPPYLRKVTTPSKPTDIAAASAVKAPVALEGVKRGLSGRIQVEGDDIGVQLDYELGVAFTQSILDTIAQRLNQTLPRMVIQFAGEFELDAPTTVVVTIAAQKGVDQVVQIDGTPAQIDLVTHRAEVDLPSGKHTIEWSLEAESLSRARLGMRDAETGTRILVTQPSGRSGRTVLTVGMLRASE